MREERGAITVMTIGFLLVLGLLAGVVVNASGAFLEHRDLDNLADGAALTAADGLDRALFYETGEVRADSSDARRLVAEYVAGTGARVVSVTMNGDSISVRLERTVDLALSPPGLPARTTVVADATSQLRVAD